jgi:hypothetical protein
MEHASRGQQFPHNDVVVAAARKLVISARPDVYKGNKQFFVHRWQKYRASGGDYVE